eukprot:TRINITY_DN6448_c0_g1_i1.p1 TRINITY_DN6448_c0_g1~~TRINITY_DN6448_c0_g1_i1.p1  ORF type:complete len:292 (+),score=65.16 TRINITY_DN6448_c0_g1_i1:126-878(+)
MWVWGQAGKPPRRKQQPEPSTFPEGLRVFSYLPSEDGVDENLLIMLHGVGDTHRPLLQLGRSFHLPQTAVLAFQAPVPLPFDMGYCWHDTFDDEGDTLAYTPGDERRMKSLNASTSTLIQAIEVLRLQLHWPADRIFLLGYAQGGTVALSAALTLAHASAPPISALGGVISICGVLLEEQLAMAAGTGAAPARPAAEATPVLILCGDKDAQAPPHLAHASAAALHSSGSSAGNGSDSSGSSTAGAAAAAV